LHLEGFQNGSFLSGAVRQPQNLNQEKRMAPEYRRRSRSARRIGYARVSTEDQNLALQLDALAAAGCDQIFQDNGVSGSVVKRPGLDSAIAALQEGGALVVWKLDRLGRISEHLTKTVRELGEQGIGFQSLSEAIDTVTPGGRLTYRVMAALAEFERDLISERTKAGMASARMRGIPLGRPRKLSAVQIAKARLDIERGGQDARLVAGRLGVSPVTLARALKKAA
jgi:DNA invertase Pin-like site-specific DNA recombinase